MKKFRFRSLQLYQGGIFTFYEQAEKEYQNVLQQIHLLEPKLDALPEGDFICARNENRYKWYYTINGEKTYIPKKDVLFAEKLAAKKYYSTLLSYLEHEKSALESYFKKHSQKDFQKIKNILFNPEYQKLLGTSFSSKSQELSEWATADYKRNEKYPETLTHKTSSGFYVRSKSEAMIVFLLQANNIPFRYECELQLGNITLYPDFTIRHPKTGDFYYWEHFGMMDDPVYAQNALRKLQNYTSNGMIPSIQLITTYETQNHPLTLETISETIQKYFL